jgi:hypothetical protein
MYIRRRGDAVGGKTINRKVVVVVVRRWWWWWW